MKLDDGYKIEVRDNGYALLKKDGKTIAHCVSEEAALHAYYKVRYGKEKRDTKKAV